jgi:hypothetical protein
MALFYLHTEAGGSSLPLLGCERRRSLPEGLLPLPCVRDDHGLVLVQAVITRGEGGQAWQERRYLRVL